MIPFLSFSKVFNVNHHTDFRYQYIGILNLNEDFLLCFPAVDSNVLVAFKGSLKEDAVVVQPVLFQVNICKSGFSLESNFSHRFPVTIDIQLDFSPANEWCSQLTKR